MKEQGVFKYRRKSLKRLSNIYTTRFEDPNANYSPFERLIDLSTLSDTDGFDDGNSSDGSILFPGLQASYLSTPNNVDFNFGTGDFTVEWWQHQTPSKPYQRVFSIGSWNGTPALGATFAVSVEGSGTGNYAIYVWMLGNIIASGMKHTVNRWHHFAVCRSGTDVTIFIDGTSLSTTTCGYDLTDNVNPLTIGGEIIYPNSAFSGYITNFKWTKGRAIYTGNFTVSRSRMSAEADTKLLLLSVDEVNLITDSSGTAKVITNNGGGSAATFAAKTPLNV